MTHHVSYDKLSKRLQKFEDSKLRRFWTISPVTRRPPKPNAYCRSKAKKAAAEKARQYKRCLMKSYS